MASRIFAHTAVPRLPVASLGVISGLLLSTLLLMPKAEAASCKLPKSYYKNVSCTSDSRYFLAEKDLGAPVALLNSNGKKVLDLTRYQTVAADKLAGGLLPVQRYDRVGYVNLQGQEVVPVMYDRLSGGSDWARAVAQDRIVVKKDGEYGVISTTNRVVVPFSSSISSIDNFKNDRARVQKNKTTSWIDKDGRAIATPNANNERDASKKLPSTNSMMSAAVATSASVFTTLKPHQQDGRWGFVDDNEVTMITYSFDEVKPFSEGMAGVRMEDKWGFVNLGGELVIPFRYPDNLSDIDDASAFVFKEGKAWVGNLRDGGKTCVSLTGETVSCG